MSVTSWSANENYDIVTSVEHTVSVGDNGKRYRKFMKELREKLPIHVCPNCPDLFVLKPASNAQIRLESSEGESIIVLIGVDGLYLKGYKREKDTDFWLFPSNEWGCGFQKLKFFEDYDSLSTVAGLKNKLTKLSLNRHGFNSSINALATLNPHLPKHQTRIALGLLRLIVMLLESVKFKRIQDFTTSVKV